MASSGLPAKMVSTVNLTPPPVTCKSTTRHGAAVPYGIDATPTGEIYYASLAGNHIAKIDIETGEATPIDSPTANQGAPGVE